VASAEKSEDSKAAETDEVSEEKRAAVERDKDQQRQQITQWKVCTLTYLLIITVVFIVCIQCCYYGASCRYLSFMFKSLV